MPRDAIWNSDPVLRAEAEELTPGIEDFYAYLPMHSYLHVPTRMLWPSSSVNACIKPIASVDDRGNPGNLSASKWLDRNRFVEQMTWAPGLPMIVTDRYIFEGGWAEHPGARCFNLYRPPPVHLGNPTQGARWEEHLRFVYPNDADHIINWLAHRVQKPEEKINHALVLGGGQGIGKDSLLAPVKYAIGAWNFREASPIQMQGRFNGFVKGVILRVSEGHDLGEYDRFQFYEHMKTYTASPPEVLRVDEKHLREYEILNVCGIIITTNHKSDGIYLPADDRRHYVAWSDTIKEDPKFREGYWDDLWAWYNEGGFRHVAALLQQHDISGFNPKASPPRTATFWAIADANRAPEEPELADLIDRLGAPDVITLELIREKAEGSFGEWIRDRKNVRVIPHRLESCGYVAVRNPDATSGLWRINGKRQVVYAKGTLPLCDQITAVRGL